MDRHHPLRIIGPERFATATALRDGAPPDTDDTDDDDRQAVIAKLRGRLLRLIVDNQRNRSHEDQPNPAA